MKAIASRLEATKQEQIASLLGARTLLGASDLSQCGPPPGSCGFRRAKYAAGLWLAALLAFVNSFVRHTEVFALTSRFSLLVFFIWTLKPLFLPFCFWSKTCRASLYNVNSMGSKISSYTTQTSKLSSGLDDATRNKGHRY